MSLNKKYEEIIVSPQLRGDNVIVHTLWVGSRLSLLECLTIKLLQKHGHIVNLWTYDKIENVPSGVIIRDANKILPEESIFKYNGIPHILLENGGIGSISHWSDQFQTKLLYEEGGIYLQLDVAILRPLNFKNDHVFVPYADYSINHASERKGVSAFLMKCPKGSEFAKKTYMELSSKINSETIKSMEWDCSMNKMNENIENYFSNSEKYFIDPSKYWDLGGIQYGPFFENVRLPKDLYIIHWSNATHKDKKDNPIKDSIYGGLLKLVGLI